MEADKEGETNISSFYFANFTEIVCRILYMLSFFLLPKGSMISTKKKDIDAFIEEMESIRDK